MELKVLMSKAHPSVTCPPFLGVAEVVGLPPVPQASRNPTVPAPSAARAAVPPSRRRNSRRDQAPGKRWSCSDDSSGALMPTSALLPSHSGSRVPSRVAMTGPPLAALWNGVQRASITGLGTPGEGTVGAEPTGLGQGPLSPSPIASG